MRKLMTFTRLLCVATLLWIVPYRGSQVRAAEASGGMQTVWDGIYTQAQADRGKATFQAQCSECHKPDLSGDYGPQLAGPKFRTVWDAATLNELFTKMVKTMPKNSAHLAVDLAPDVIAYILSQNGFPAGNASLTPDANVLRGAFRFWVRMAPCRQRLANWFARSAV